MSSLWCQVECVRNSGCSGLFGEGVWRRRPGQHRNTEQKVSLQVSSQGLSWLTKDVWEQTRAPQHTGTGLPPKRYPISDPLCRLPTTRSSVSAPGGTSPACAGYSAMLSWSCLIHSLPQEMRYLLLRCLQPPLWIKERMEAIFPMGRRAYLL